MVTIEEKISLFSKILQQEMKNHVADEMISVDKEYEVKKYQQHEDVQKKTKEILDKAKKEAIKKQMQIESKGKIWAQKKKRDSKEKIFKKLLQSVEQRVIEFTKSKEYTTYLENQIKVAMSLFMDQQEVVMKVTPYDLEKYKDFITTQFVEAGMSQEKITFQSDANLLGGFVLEKADYTRADLSLANKVQEYKEWMFGKLTKALEQTKEVGAGETIE
jgi:V/A-type H+-transporting ATPase subunit E